MNIWCKVLLFAVISVFLAGCQQKTSERNDIAEQGETQRGEIKKAGIDNVLIEDFSYLPMEITVKKGTKVIWTNKDDIEHTVTSISGDELDSGIIPRLDEYTYTFNKVGTYEYYCEKHPTMRGSVVVE